MGGSPGAGGSTAAGGAGAAAGAGPIGGTGGSAVPGLCPTDGSLPPANAELMPESGYIDDADATGILGPWYTLSCDSAQVDPAVGEPVVPVEGQVCFSGTVPQAAADDPDACWGAAIGFDLCTAPEDPSSLPEPQNTWEPGSAHTAAECGVVVSGVSFELSGQVPPELRIVFQEAGREDSLYAVVSEAGAVCQCVADIPLGVDAGAPGVSADDLQAIHIQVVPSEVGPVSFDFCIGNLSVW